MRKVTSGIIGFSVSEWINIVSQDEAEYQRQPKESINSMLSILKIKNDDLKEDVNDFYFSTLPVYNSQSFFKKVLLQGK